jgi:hypothetical protein
MIAKSKFALAVITVAILALNLIGACAPISAVSAQTHPCCPKAPSSQKDCETPGCICLNTPPAKATFLPTSDHGSVLTLIAEARIDLAEFATAKRFLPARVLVAPNDRYLSIHQLLL